MHGLHSTAMAERGVAWHGVDAYLEIAHQVPMHLARRQAAGLGQLPPHIARHAVEQRSRQLRQRGQRQRLLLRRRHLAGR